MIPVVLLGFLVVPCSVAEGWKHNAYHLEDTHPTNDWRRFLGRPIPGFEDVLLWTCHERVGIGNNLGAFTHAMKDALSADSKLVIQSIILQKHCEMLGCAWNLLPGTEGYVKAKHTKLAKVEHLNQGPDIKGPTDLLIPYYNASGCLKPPHVRAQCIPFDKY